MAAYVHHDTDEFIRLGIQIREAAIDADPRLRAQDAFGHADDNLRAHIRPTYESVPWLFDAFGDPNPHDAMSTVDDLMSVSAALGCRLPLVLDSDAGGHRRTKNYLDRELPVNERVERTVLKMNDWDGTAAVNFRDKFLAPLTTSASVLGDLAFVLAKAMEAGLEVRRLLNTDVWNVGTATRDLLEASAGGLGPGQSVNTTLKVWGAVRGVLSAVKTTAKAATLAEAAPEALAYTLVSTALTTDWKSIRVSIAGSTPTAVLGKMAEAVSTAMDGADTQNAALTKGIQAVATEVSHMPHLLPAYPNDLLALGNKGAGRMEGYFYDNHG